MNIAIMTDTNSGIDKELAKSLGIFLMHMPVIIDDRIYYENDTLTDEEYYSALEDFKNISTSQPSPGDVKDMWEKIFSEGYEQIVYIPMSSGLSSSCAVSSACSGEYDGNVYVVDNHRISVTLRESVIMAKELSKKGFSAAEIKERLEEDAYNSSIYIAVNTLKYLKRGGRITPAAAMLGSVLSIKPILTIQGEKLDSFQKVRGSINKALPHMLDAVSRDISARFSHETPDRTHIGLAGSNLSDDDISAYMTLAKESFPDADVYYSPLSASISCHTGPGALGIGLSFR